MIATIVAYDKDVKWLREQDKRIYEERPKTFTPNMGGAERQILVSQSRHGEVLTAAQVNRVLACLERNAFIFTPCSIDFGFVVAYSVLLPGPIQRDVYIPTDPPQTERLITFGENQIPKQFTFDRLSKYFLSERNLQLVKQYGLPEIKSYSHYDY